VEETVDEPNPLTPEMKQAFGNAVLAYNDWRHQGGSERMLTIGESRQLHSTYSICGFVLAFANEPLPDRLAILLARMPDQTRADLMTKIKTYPTYHSGAYCLGELIKDHHLRLAKRGA
jgi:hypothetical protein